MIKKPIRLYTQQGTALTLDGMHATLGSTVASIHKATAKDGINIIEMLDSLSKVLDRHDMSASSIKQYSDPRSHLKPIDAFSGFTVLVEEWCAANLGFAFKDNQFAFGTVHIKIKGGLFSSSERKKTACKNDVLDAVQHFYGSPLDISFAPSASNRSQLFYSTEKTLCTVLDKSSKGVFSSESAVLVNVYDREFWDPSTEDLRSIAGT